MPQLMPLNWFTSSLMVILLMMSACIIYSEIMSFTQLEKELKSMQIKKNLWFW